MAATKTVLTSVLAHGGRTARHGEFTVVYMHDCTFVTSPMEFTTASNWARARMSCGNPAKDRSAFVDRIENVLARSGGGIATRGSRQALARIVKNMISSAMIMEEWSVPHDLNAGVEIKRKPVAPVVAAVPVVAVAVAAVAAVAGAPVVATVAVVAAAATAAVVAGNK